MLQEHATCKELKTLLEEASLMYLDILNERNEVWRGVTGGK